MKKNPVEEDTVVGAVDRAVLEFTAGRDREQDIALLEVDCIGSAAHATVLSRLPPGIRIFSARERSQVIAALVELMGAGRRGEFRISPADQDVHLAVERYLTSKLGVLGRRLHTGRSRNDQAAVDLRLYAKTALQDTVEAAAGLAAELSSMGRRHRRVPMVGRTHLQPAMPSSIGLWAGAHAESLLDDIVLLLDCYGINDQCPLGAAAGYGVPLPLDRQLAARLLAFRRPCANVLHAVSARGKTESMVLSSLVQVMLSLSRLAEDMIIFSMPEFGYFRLPENYATGSSIMPQKRNPDVLELIRARSSRVLGDMVAAASAVKALPSGYSRDMQETKEPLLRGLETTISSLRISAGLLKDTYVDRDALRRGFTPQVFATDEALRRVAAGVPFRDAYRDVKKGLPELGAEDPERALDTREAPGGAAGIDWDALSRRISEARRWARDERRFMHSAWSRLLGVKYPFAEQHGVNRS